MITNVALDLYDDDELIERRIKYLRNKRVELGNEIDRIRSKYPRCPHCEKRYYIGKYSCAVNSSGFIKKYNNDQDICVKCPLGHELMIRTDIEMISDENNFTEFIGRKIEDLDFGYMD